MTHNDAGSAVIDREEEARGVSACTCVSAVTGQRERARQTQENAKHPLTASYGGKRGGTGEKIQLQRERGHAK